MSEKSATDDEPTKLDKEPAETEAEAEAGEKAVEEAVDEAVDEAEAPTGNPLSSE